MIRVSYHGNAALDQVFSIIYIVFSVILLLKDTSKRSGQLTFLSIFGDFFLKFSLTLANFSRQFPSQQKLSVNSFSDQRDSILTSRTVGPHW